MRVQGSGSTGTGASLLKGIYYAGAPDNLAIDKNNNIWSAASSGLIGVYTNSTGYPFAETTTKSGSSPFAATVDMLGNVWLNAGKSCVSGVGGVTYELPASSYAAPTLTAGYYESDQNCTGTTYNGTVALPSGVISNTVTSIAADANNGIWQTNETNTTSAVMTYLLPTSSSWSTTSAIMSTNAAMSTSAGLSGLDNPYAVAVDGSNRAWVANNSGTTISVLKANVSGNNITSLVSAEGSTGIVIPSSATGIYPKSPKGILIDPSGNVWILNATTSGVNYVSVIVGAATPVITPLTFQVLYNLVGSTPQ
jgi:hypothetical protein